MSDVRINPQTGLPEVWTGTGYEPLPTYSASDFGMFGTVGQDPGSPDSSGMTMDPSTGQLVPWNTPKFGFSPEAAAKYGDLFGGASPNNWMLTSGGQGGMDFLLKSGDKEGTRVSYTLKDGKYVPSVAGTQQWNTSPTAKDYMPLAILGGGLAAAFAPATAAAAGAAGSAAGSAPGWAGAGLFDAAAAGGGVGGWIAPQGLAAAGGAAAGSAPGWKGAGLYDAAVGGGGTSGWIGAEGLGGGLLNGAKGIAEKIGPSNLMKLGGLLGGVLGGGAAGQSDAAGDPYAGVQPIGTPTMYGGNAAPPSFQTVGPTETERRMTQQYLPALFGQGLLGGNMVSPVRRDLLGSTKWAY